MSSPFFTRRSERFAELLDEATRRRDATARRRGAPIRATMRRHRHRPRSKSEVEARRLVDTASLLAMLPIRLMPTEEFRGGLRAMLLATMDRDGLPVEDKGAVTVPLGALAAKTGPRSPTRTKAVRGVPSPGTGRTRAAVLIGVTAGALALSGVSAASTDSLPGDPLYQVKRSSERAQLALAGSDQSRGQLYLEFAHGRLAEARRVSSAQLAGVLADMDTETMAGVRLLTTTAVQRRDATILDALMSFLDQQRSLLDDVHQTLTVAGVEPMRQSFALLDSVGQRTRSLTTALARGCAIQTVDNLGPKPAAC